MNRVHLALLFTERLIALAVILQALEMLSMRKIFTPDGIWNWETLKKDYEGAKPFVKKILEGVFKDSNFVLVPATQLLAGILMLVFPSFLMVLILFVSTLLISMRFRGAFNGGSDSMTLIILGALGFARLFGSFPIMQKAALYFIAVQIVLSYFLSGLWKVKQAQWRSGTALPEILRSPYYGVPDFIQKTANSGVWKLAAFFILAFELAFPLSIFSPKLAFFFVSLAFLFHVANVCLFGLNRFLFAWMAGYPALIYTSQLFL